MLVCDYCGRYVSHSGNYEICCICANVVCCRCLTTEVKDFYIAHRYFLCPDCIPGAMVAVELSWQEWGF